ncbi:acyltransferase family protein [Dinghuibacter silviterrae]|uniref:acyltransferase family protein n=1 Tax=Dinghuibacter silviterrae TaxID=1539049 RepID=UPI0013C2A0A0|nr:acyltransferase [Dinghuibacter silviterrae]
MKRLSTHREALMGLAILWIMLFHAEVVLPKPLSWIQETGYGGVDIFLFLSGLGLYYSLAKDARVGRFYWNRFIRILPTYWAVIILATLMEYVVLHRHTPWVELFYELSTTGFWLNATKFDWYVPSLLVLYLVFPLFFRAFRARGAMATGVVVVLGVALSLAITATRFNYLLIFTTRIPIFFLGAQAGYMIRENRSKADSPAALLAGGAPLWGQLALFGLGLAGLVAAFHFFTPQQRWWNGTWWYPFIFITPALCNGLAFLFDRFPARALRWCGRYSLEIYLVHTLVFGLHKETARFFPNDFVAYAVYVVISLPLAWVLNKVMGFITRIFTKHV